MDRKFEIVGPFTKSAVALAIRRQRKAGKPVPTLPAPPQLRKPAVLVAIKEIRTPPSPQSKISNVCRGLGITPRTVRLYEEKGLIACERDGKGGRILNEHARTRLEKIIELKRVGLSLAEIDMYLQSPEQSKSRLLKRLQRQLDSLNEQREAVTIYMDRLG